MLQGGGARCPGPPKGPILLAGLSRPTSAVSVGSGVQGGSWSNVGMSPALTPLQRERGSPTPAAQWAQQDGWRCGRWLLGALCTLEDFVPRHSHLGRSGSSVLCCSDPASPGKEGDPCSGVRALSDLGLSSRCAGEGGPWAGPAGPGQASRCLPCRVCGCRVCVVSIIAALSIRGRI